MARMCDGRVVIVTGAGSGIGREYAMQLDAHGAQVVVNDLGTGRDGRGTDGSAAAAVAAEISGAGGEAVADNEDTGEYAKMLIKSQALSG